MSLEKLVFDSIALREIEVEIAGKEYILTEASEDATIKYKDARMQAAKIEGTNEDDIKIVGFNSLNNVEPLLVSLCLHEVWEYKGEKRRKPVDLKTILAWPPKIVRKLYKWVKDNSDLDEEASVTTLEDQLKMLQERVNKAKELEELQKKEQSATSDTSK